ncbi:MAG TPA: FtsX-like permease family protein, partial [Acidimicrobiales bacterium]|nr:FtsX-like permease family protein [Acidimicrobiales bacterium]
DRAFRSMNRVLVVRGRLSNVDDADEVMVNELAARRLHVDVGSHLTLHAFTLDQILGQSTSGTGPLAAPAGPTFGFRVVGVVRAPADVNPGPQVDVVYAGQEVVAMTPAFLRAYAGALGTVPDALPGMEGVRVRLLHGLADLDAFRAAARPVIGPQGQILTGSDTSSAAASVNRATRFQAAALLAFAGLAGLGALLILGQSLARQVELDAADHPVRRALGMSTRQLSLTSLCRVGLIGAGGAALAPFLAVAFSPLFPIGLARRAEMRPGAAVDLPVLLVGAVVVLVLVLLRSSVSAWRLAATTTGAGGRLAPGRRSRVADALAGAGAPVPAVAGVRMSLEGAAAGSGLAVRGAMVGAVAAVAGVIAALVFASSLDTLAVHPRSQGWNWDVLVGNPNSQGDVASTSVPTLAANPYVGSFAGLVPVETVSLAGHPVDAMAVDTGTGNVFPTVLEGRDPRQVDEVLVGTATLHAIGRHVGDTVEARAGDRRTSVRIVGRAVFPTQGLTAAGDMNAGTVMTAATAHQLFPDLDSPKLFVVRFARGADRVGARASLQHDFPRLVLPFVPNAEVENLRRVGGLPFALAGLLVLLGVGVLANALVTTIRRRRRDLAVLKTLGFVRSQVGATVAWQASTLALVALLAGLPLGIAGGRWVWGLVVGQLGTRSGPVVPALAVAVTAVATMAVANLLAAGPGWMASRARPAVILRSE